MQLSVCYSWGSSESAALLSAKTDVQRLYPEFDNWLTTTVQPGISSGERRIFFVRQDACLLGFAIAKRTLVERKLCTIWTSPSVRGNGVASLLSQSAFGWMGTNKPLFSAASETVSQFRPLLAKWGFVLGERRPDFYRKNSTEYVFNGSLGLLVHAAQDSN